MSDPIVIQLQARGVQEIQAIFRTLEQAITGFERNIGTAGERGARARTTATQREGADREKAFAKLARDAEKWERQAAVAAERLAKEKSRATERSAAEQVRAVEKAEQEKQRAAERSARAMDRIRERSATMAGQYAAREADREIREHQRAFEARKAFARNMGGMVAGSVSGAIHGIVGTGRGLVAGALQVGGGFSVADSVSRELKLTNMAATLAASSKADEDGKKWKTAEILRSARGTANSLSMDPDEVLKGIGKYKDLTGNLGDAVKLAPHMAKLATALGADTGELMENAGNAYNAGLRGEDIMKMARVQTKQGMEGAVELKDMAKYGARISGAAGLYGGDRATNMATVGALAQVARQHGPATTPAEAMMGALRFTTDVAKHAKDLEKQGIKTSDGKGTLLGADVIMRQMLEKSGGDVTKLGSMGLGDRGVKPLMGFAQIYRDAMGGTRQKGETEAAFAGRQAKGKAAVLAEFDKYTSGVSDASIDAAAKERLGEADKQVTRAMNELRDAVGTQLLPELVKMVPVLRDLTPMIASVLREATKFAEWFAKNPIKGVGAVVLAAIAKDLAAAAIGEAVKRALVALLAGSAPGAGAGGALGAAGGGSAAAGGAVLAGGAVQVGLLAKVGAETGAAVTSGKEEGQNIAAMLASADPAKRAEGQKRLDAAKAKSGTVAKTDATLERSAKVLTALVNPVAALSAYGGEKAAAAMGGPAGKTNTDRSLETIKANEIVNTVELRKQIANAVVGGVVDGMASKAGTAASASAPSTTQPLSARP